MNQSDLIANVARATGISKADAERAVKATLNEIGDAIERKEEVNLAGFGTFRIEHRNARTGRNPQTGEAMDIPAKNVIKFSPGKALRESVN